MNIDDLKDLNEADKQQIVEWKRVTREKYGGDTYAKAQYNIGSLYFENDYLEETLKAWEKIKLSDNPKLYSQVRVDIGLIYNQKGSDKRALEEWAKIERLDSTLAYAHAQFHTGATLHKKSDDQGALKAWNGIRRNDNLKVFIEVKFLIAEILLKNNDNEGAIASWRNIKRSDDPIAFAKAQINIGSIFIDEDNREDALKTWNNIERKDNAEIFADAQFYIGHELHNRADIDGALEAWSQIIRSDNPEIYAKAQFNIGATLRKQNNNGDALLAWRNVERSDDPESFAKAKFVIGVILNEKDKKDEAIIEWNSVYRKDDNKMFAQAQFNIGCEFSDRNDSKSALSAWNAIERSIDPEMYARAKVKIGFLLEKMQDIKGAVSEWSKIKRSDDAEAYVVAQANIGYLSYDRTAIAKNAFLNIKSSDNPRIYAHSQFKLALIFIDEGNFEDAEKSFSIAKDYYPYESYCYEKICNLIKSSKTKKFGLSSRKLLNLVLEIVSILTLDFGKYADEEKPFERKLAHYTSTYTCNLLLGNDKKNNSPSLFRLNTINNVNDPSEGQLLVRKLKGIKDNDFIALDFNEKFHAFISCFTFNHDSLNQFRLYGKQDNKEASGMSLVFKKEFFQSKNFIGGISYLSIENTSKVIKTLPNLTSEKSYDMQKQALENKSNHEEIVKHSVMRCVYLDPKSDYFHLAQRNRLTFFREFGDNTVLKKGLKQPQAEYEWDIYQEYIKIITNDFKVAYEDLKSTYKEVQTETENVMLDPNSLERKELGNLVDEILLPLKYLIKHSAFREEQECRIIYITATDRPEVTMEYGSFLYVEYEPSVKQNLDKIYIAPGALHHKRYFDYVLGDIDVPVEVSGNVFR